MPVSVDVGRPACHPSSPARPRTTTPGRRSWRASRPASTSSWCARRVLARRGRGGLRLPTDCLPTAQSHAVGWGAQPNDEVVVGGPGRCRYPRGRSPDHAHLRPRPAPGAARTVPSAGASRPCPCRAGLPWLADLLLSVAPGRAPRSRACAARRREPGSPPAATTCYAACCSASGVHPGRRARSVVAHLGGRGPRLRDHEPLGRAARCATAAVCRSRLDASRAAP